MTTPIVIPTPPLTPSRKDPENFAEHGDATMAYLPELVTAANALAQDVYARQQDVEIKQTSATASATAAAASATAAELAKNQALVSKNTALDARADAIAAMGQAETAAQAAENSKTAAATSAAQAAASASPVLSVAGRSGNVVVTKEDVGLGVGGALNGVAVGGAPGSFTTLSATGNTTLGDSSTDTTTINGQLLPYGKGGSSSNVAVGSGTFATNSTGLYSVAVGANALAFNTSGSFNSAVGNYSLFVSITGYYNTAMGYRSAYSLRTGGYNIVIGGDALQQAVTGDSNVVIGSSAGIYLKPTGKPISAIANYSGTVAGTVLATSTAHGLTGTVTRSIAGTTSYNGAKSLTVVNADTFYFTAAFVASETGLWHVASEGNLNTLIGNATGAGIVTGSGNTILGANVGGLASGLENNIILANGTGAIKAQHDGSNWTLAGGISATGKVSANAVDITQASGYSTITANSSKAVIYLKYNAGSTGVFLGQNSSGEFELSWGGTSATILTAGISGLAVPGALSAAGTASFASANFIVASNGNVTNTNNSYGGISDIKHKDRITDTSPKLPKMLLVRVVDYFLKSQPGQKLCGVIAQELEKIWPGLVEESPDYEEVEISPARTEIKITKQQVVEYRDEVRYDIAEVDGKWTKLPIRTTVEVPLFTEHPLYAEDGSAVMECIQPAAEAVVDEQGDVITPATPAVWQQTIHRVPVTEDISEEVEIPEVTERRATGTVTKSVKYSVFVPLLIKAMQEQQVIIDGQGSCISDLAARLAALEAA